MARDLSQPKISNFQFSRRSSSCKASKPLLTNRELAVTGCRLASSASFALLLISLAGDVSRNPGPVALPSLSVRDFMRFRGLKVAHLNIRSVYPKLDSLKLWLLNQPFDVFTVSETWLKPSILDNEIQIPGYSCARSDRLHKTVGGAMAYVRDGIPYRLRPDLGASLPESCVIEISRPKCKKLIIWTIYRAPDSNLETFIQDLNTSLSLVPIKTELILLVDFNINFASSEMSNDKAKKRKLPQVTNVHHLYQVNNTSMRITETSSTLIDLLFTNTSHRVIDRGVIPVIFKRPLFDLLCYQIRCS